MSGFELGSWRVIVVGLNAYHADAAACLVRDGKLIAAAEEERFRRIKHWAGFPSRALAYCLSEAGVRLTDVAHVAINSDPRASFWRRIAYVARTRPSVGLVLDRVRNQRRRTSVEQNLAEAFADSRFTGCVHRVEHHLAHLASCFHVSPFDRAVAVSLDGFGDFSSAAWGLGQGSDIRIDGRVHFPHSLGIFYQALTQYLGFPHYGDEYKIMGLAPYGAPRYLAEMHRIVRLEGDGAFRLDTRYFRHHREHVAYQWADGAPIVGALFSDQLVELLGPPREAGSPITQRHRDIARSAQAMYEEAFFHLLARLHSRYCEDRLVLAGGCAMNSVANGKIARMTPFRSVYVQAASGDAGGAIGAAFAVWHRFSRERQFVMCDAYWGPAYTNENVRTAIERRQDAITSSGTIVLEGMAPRDVGRRAAEATAGGKVIGWFQGRMEWGPRALGNRSILADPRRANMKNVLNDKIKRRESFRPFAPAVLEEAASDWFEDSDPVPFMERVYQIREAKRAIVPAVTHVDGSGRLQTVSLAANPRFYEFIKAFEDITGVPMVLNTSFNENEPVVCTPDEALDCFLRTNMDMLVLGNTLVERRCAPDS